jgi:hypothetical protein
MSRSYCLALRSVEAITDLRAISSCYDNTVNGSKLAPIITNSLSTPEAARFLLRVHPRVRPH